MSKHTEQGPFEVIDLDSPFLFGVARKMTAKERKEAIAHGGDPETPMSVLGVIQACGTAGVFGRGTADLFAAAPALLEALKAQEEAERAQDAYRREEKAPLCGLPAEDHDAWKLRLSDLAQDAFELTAKAKALRTAALAQAEPATPVQ